MSLHLERIEWMPSPPLAPDDGPIDIDHLRRMTLGDAGLEREVLAMFSAQSASLIASLAAQSFIAKNSIAPKIPTPKIPAPKIPAAKSAADKSAGAAALAHSLKGSAKAIGAFRVAEAAESLEIALRNGEDPSAALAEVDDAVAEARAAIDELLRRS
jgi:HPt (histidine-containing phosphotransfer) domain-containing protein